jgi:hypothetical protein
LHVEAIGEMLSDSDHAMCPAVSGVTVIVLLAVLIGEAVSPYLGNASRDPVFNHSLKAVVTDGKELCAVVEDPFLQVVGSHTPADPILVLKYFDADVRILEHAGGDEAGETGAHYYAGLHVRCSF